MTIHRLLPGMVSNSKRPPAAELRGPGGRVTVEDLPDGREKFFEIERLVQRRAVKFPKELGDIRPIAMARNEHKARTEVGTRLAHCEIEHVSRHEGHDHVANDRVK